MLGIVGLQEPSSCQPSETKKRQRAMFGAASCAKTLRLTAFRQRLYALPALRQWPYASRPVRGSESNVIQVDVSIIYTLLVSMHLFSRFLAVVVFLFISIRPHEDDAKRARSLVYRPTKRNVQYVLRELQVEYCKVHVCSSASDCCRRRRSCARSAGGSHTCEVTGVALAYAYACLLWRLPRAHCWQWIETFRPVTGATSQMTLVGIPLIVLCGGCLLRAVGSVSRCCVQ